MLQDGPESWTDFHLCKSVSRIEGRWDVTDVRYLVLFEGHPCERYINHQQATLNSAYRPEMPNRAEIRGTVGAEFKAHAFQSFHLLSFNLRTVWLFVTTLGCCDAS
jgi:hypothetical protein